MTEAEILKEVKKALGITGAFLDGTLLIYVKEVIQYLLGAGAPSGIVYSSASVGVISRGVADLWNYGAAGGKLSEYFMQRAIQLSYQTEESEPAPVSLGLQRVCTITQIINGYEKFDDTNGIYKDGNSYFLDYSVWALAARDSKAGWNITLAQIDDEAYYPPMDLFVNCLLNSSGMATLKIWTTGLITLLPTVDVIKGGDIMVEYSAEYGGWLDA